MKRKIFTHLPWCLVIVCIASCNQNPKGQQAEVGEAKAVAEIQESAVIYNVNTKQSVVTWIGSKPTGQHNGTIRIDNGTLAVASGKITGGSFVMDIQSLQVNDLEKGGESHTKLTNHLMSDDFFAANQHPKATFELVEVVPYDSSMISADKEQFPSDYTPATLSEFMIASPTHLITGNLTMRGITKSVKFPAQVSIGANSIQAEAKFNLDRTNWNLMYGDEASVADKAKDQFIYNTVNVGFSLSAEKQQDENPVQ